MSSQSPASVLFSSDGYELSAVNGSSIPSNTRGLLVEGSDGTNSRFISVDTSGRVVLVGAGTAGTGVGGVITIQGNASGTPVPVSGTVTANNASVSTTGSVAPGSATFAGALVTTAVQSGLTNTDMYALNMTTTGLLRVDGSNVTQPVSIAGTVTVAQATATNLNATVVGLGTSGAVNVSQVTAANLNATVVQTTASNLNATIVQSTASNLNATIVGTTAAGSGASSNLVTVQGNASGTPIPVSGTFTVDKSTTGTLTNVSATTTSTTLLAANAARISATFFNDSPTEILFIGLTSATVSQTSYTIKIMPLSYWDLPAYTGQINGIWNNSAGGVARITELT